jgi:hypothetical protein
VKSARSAGITAVSSFPSCCHPIHGDGRPSARAAASQVIVGHTRPRSRPPGARLPACARRGQPQDERRAVLRHVGCVGPDDVAGIRLGGPWSRPLVREQLMAHGMRSALVEVHARHWGMAHLMAGRGSPPSAGAGWLFSVWPQERPPGDGGALRDDSIVLSLSGHCFRAHVHVSCVGLGYQQPKPLAAHDRCGVRSVGRVGVGACCPRRSCLVVR